MESVTKMPQAARSLEQPHIGSATVSQCSTNKWGGLRVSAFMWLFLKARPVILRRQNLRSVKLAQKIQQKICILTKCTKFHDKHKSNIVHYICEVKRLTKCAESVK